MNIKSKEYKKLFSAIKINHCVLKNRFVLSPMTLNASSKNGFISDKDLRYAQRRASSAPLAITGAAYINKEGQLFEFGFGAYSKKHIKGLSKFALKMKQNGAKAILQLAHSGRFSIISLKRNGYVVGASEEKLSFPFEHKVKELSVNDIKNIIKDYQKATFIAIKAGFDGVEISSAQKLLAQTFFSTFTNQRKDQYGNQNLNNRARITFEILEAVTKTIKENASKSFILGFRATAEETRGNQLGYTIEEFLWLIKKIIKNYSISYLALANWGRNIYKNKVRSRNKYFNLLVNEVIYKTFKNKIPIIASGGINTVEKCLEAIKYADLIGLSSVFVADPEFVAKFENNQIDKINLNVELKDIKKLAIPKAAFKDIVQMMDYGQSLPENTRDNFRKLEKNYK